MCMCICAFTEIVHVPTAVEASIAHCTNFKEDSTHAKKNLRTQAAIHPSHATMSYPQVSFTAEDFAYIISMTRFTTA